jgi:hypothetical protein
MKTLNCNPEGLVTLANSYARHIGLQRQPAISRKLIGLMGLKGVQGLRVE